MLTMALLTMAMPAVQADIRAALRLREPVYLSQQSAFRRNLAIACTRKMHDGVRADLQPLLGQLRGKGGKSGSAGSARQSVPLPPWSVPQPSSTPPWALVKANPSPTPTPLEPSAWELLYFPLEKERFPASSIAGAPPREGRQAAPATLPCGLCSARPERPREV